MTVVCITYKHEAFIAQALDSFLMQKTDFKFKVFVGEDCGPDGTADIVREYARRYPDVIVPFIREENMGAQRNLIDLCQRATSPYIAFCEGDDYWIDEYKLQNRRTIWTAPGGAGVRHGGGDRRAGGLAFEVVVPADGRREVTSA